MEYSMTTKITLIVLGAIILILGFLNIDLIIRGFLALIALVATLVLCISIESNNKK